MGTSRPRLLPRLQPYRVLEAVEEGEMRFEVLESTARRVEKVRVLTKQRSPIPKNPPVE